MDKPERDKRYLEWIETLPCIVTGGQPTTAHHQCERHNKAMGSKCSDYRVVPLHHEAHTFYHDKIGWKLYEDNGVDVEEIIKTLNAWWKLWHVEKIKRPVFARNVSQINNDMG